MADVCVFASVAMGSSRGFRPSPCTWRCITVISFTPDLSQTPRRELSREFLSFVIASSFATLAAFAQGPSAKGLQNSALKITRVNRRELVSHVGSCWWWKGNAGALSRRSHELTLKGFAWMLGNALDWTVDRHSMQSHFNQHWHIMWKISSYVPS